VDNRGRCEQTYTVTELPSVPPIVIAEGQMDGTTLTVLGATWDADLWQGYLLTPNRGQGEATLADNVAFTVAGNTHDTLTLADGAFDAVSSVGDTLGSLFVFRDVVIAGGAKVQTGGDVWVNGADAQMTMASASTFEGRVLEVANGSGGLLTIDHGELMLGDGGLLLN
ncbi:MAG: hypothetical protein ACPGU1_23355, partial [Myxococcota bacterium]